MKVLYRINVKGATFMEKVYQFLKESGVFFLATSEGSKPHVRAFGAVCKWEDKLYIATTNQKQVFKQMQNNPQIEICALGEHNTWIRIEAEAVVDSRREVRLQMLEENPELKQMYSADDNIFEVLFLENATAAICSYTEEPVVIRF